MRKQRRKSGQFAKRYTPHNKGKILACGCTDCVWYREDPAGWSYMTHAGWEPDPRCGTILVYIDKPKVKRWIYD